MQPQSDGSWLVQSQSDPLLFYRVGADSCACWDHFRAPEHQCKHRIAAAIAAHIRGGVLV